VGDGCGFIYGIRHGVFSGILIGIKRVFAPFSADDEAALRRALKGCATRRDESKQETVQATVYPCQVKRFVLECKVPASMFSKTGDHVVARSL
jgi:hypothetical protein